MIRAPYEKVDAAGLRLPASVMSQKFSTKSDCHSERTGPQTFFSLGVVSRRICFSPFNLSDENFWNTILAYP
jgi:hypothetical protein